MYGHFWETSGVSKWRCHLRGTAALVFGVRPQGVSGLAGRRHRSDQSPRAARAGLRLL